MIDLQNLTDDENADPIGNLVERAILGILSFVFRFLRTFFLCFWRPTRIIAEAAREPMKRTVTPPLTFLAGSILTFEALVRSFEEDADTAQSVFHNLHFVHDMSLTKLILLAGPTVGVIALLAAVSARLLSHRQRFDRNPMAASICYTLGFQLFLISGGIGMIVFTPDMNGWMILVMFFSLICVAFSTIPLLYYATRAYARSWLGERRWLSAAASFVFTWGLFLSSVTAMIAIAAIRLEVEESGRQMAESVPIEAAPLNDTQIAVQPNELDYH
ncbi:hypothetical protein [Calycomorphotria hydatis]|uniref:Yip1 domain protein n=1 Tax=Calycomorphotria hydatis TaxID=2528027 RepID=A0A517T3X9_9PLAN|nr:hypothetical protein [Calycomorphotria hydatis]QDT63075.1 hypothetical protein V22_02750 [Calycomorphotria hydatis]